MPEFLNSTWFDGVCAVLWIAAFVVFAVSFVPAVHRAPPQRNWALLMRAVVMLLLAAYGLSSIALRPDIPMGSWDFTLRVVLSAVWFVAAIGYIRQGLGRRTKASLA